MSADMSFFHLIAGASFVVQLVMLLLLVVSMVSWTMIFRRRMALKEAQAAAEGAGEAARDAATKDEA